MNDTPETEPTRSDHLVSRRTVAKTAAWAAPAILATVSSPAFAASSSPAALAVSFDKALYTVAPSESLPAGGVVVTVVDAGGPVANARVTVTIAQIDDVGGPGADDGVDGPGVEDPGEGVSGLERPTARFAAGTTFVGVTSPTGVLVLPLITAGAWQGALNVTADTTVAGVPASAAAVLRVFRDAAIVSWGYNYLGVLGAGIAAGDAVVPLGTTIPDIAGLTLGRSAGVSQFALDRSTGRIWGWGYGVPGIPGNSVVNPEPVSVGTFPGAVDVVSGYYAHYALMSDGRVLSWGYRAYAMLGDGDTADQGGYKRTPSEVKFPAEAGKIVKVAAALWNVYALDENGAVWSWGDIAFEARGDGLGVRTWVPTRVQLPEGRRAIDVSAHFYGGHVIMEDRTVWGWGCGLYDMLGVPSIAARAAVLQVPGIADAQSLFGGWYNSAVVLGDGSLRTWGTSDYAANGQGVSGGYPVGVFDNGLTGVKKVVFNAHSGLALKNDGSVWHWGYNGSGENGNGNRVSPVLRPKRVEGLAGIRDIGTTQYSYFASTR
ncbi:RCC1 domain-containing protein [Leifsonia shinshuensis]